MKKISTLVFLALLICSTGAYSQNVGVDVTTPTQKLDVAGAVRLGSTATGGAGSIRWNGTNFEVHDGTQWITFGTGTDNDWTVSGLDMYSEVSGNVGIGTTIPATKFEVVGSSRLSSLNINGNYTLPTVDGGTGFVLTTNGAGSVSWSNPALVGDITEVVAGNGLVNGGTSGIVTLDVNPGDGIVITSDEVRVQASDLDGNGITVTANNFDVNVDNATLDINSDVLRVKPEGITANEIATGAVTTSEILNGTILTGDISTGGVTSNNILDGTIVTGDISVGGVTTSNILNGTILGQDIAPSTVINQVLATTVANTTVAWVNPATLLTILQDGDADTKVTVDVGGVDEDHIRLSTLGAERMTIDNAGEIGIGTNTPDRNLHVTAPTGGVLMVTRNDVTTTAGEILGEIQFDSEASTNPSAVEASAVIRGIASETHGNSNKGGHLAFATKTGGGASGATPATERMRITNAGNVGIGSTTPGAGLHVESSGDPTLILRNTTNAGGAAIDFSDITGYAQTGSFTYRHADSQSFGYGNSFHLSGTEASLIFRVEGDGSYSGDVGIGTTAPAQKLHVVGNGRFTSMAGTGIRSLSVEADGDLTTAQPTTGASGFWTRSGSVLFPTNTDDVDLNNQDLVDFSDLVSRNDVAQPRLVLESSSSGDNWTSQGAMVAIGESASSTGAAAMYMTYRGDGYGFIGSGAVVNAEPGASYLRFDYNADNIYTPDNLSIGTTSTEGQLNVVGRVEFLSSTDASGTPGSGVLEIGNALRIDDNEIITNANAPLYINTDNNGDVQMDGGTFFVDASANSVGLGTTAPSTTLDVNGTVRIRGGAPNPGDMLMATSTNGTATWSVSGYGLVPIGSIIAWHGNMLGVPGLPAGWVQCNGGTVSDAASPMNGAIIPNLNSATTSQSGDASRGRFLRGSTTSGLYEGDNSNNLEWINHDDSGNGDSNDYLPDNGGTVTIRNYSTSGDRYQAELDGTETRVTNMSVRWIIRIK